MQIGEALSVHMIAVPGKSIHFSDDQFTFGDGQVIDTFQESLPKLFSFSYEVLLLLMICKLDLIFCRLY